MRRYFLYHPICIKVTVIFNGNSQKWALLIISFNFSMNFQCAHIGRWPEFQEETPSTLIYNNSTAKGNPAQARFHQNQSRTLSQHLFTILLKLFSYHRINLGELIATWMMFLPTAHFLIISHPRHGIRFQKWDLAHKPALLARKTHEWPTPRKKACFKSQYPDSVVERP